jgi:uncharacterized sulfatase
VSATAFQFVRKSLARTENRYGRAKSPDTFTAEPSMNRQRVLPWIALLTVALLGPAALADEAKDRPNVLWITCEDISPNLGCYGDSYAVTPNLDRLATQGVRYTHAFAPIGVCAPSRSSLITGMFAPSFGTHPMRCQGTLPDSVRCFPEYLRQAGYYCTNNVKTDYNTSAKT